MRDTSILGVKSWRIAKGISLDAVATSTKLGTRVLEAIERGDFKRLPGGIYDINFIRQYARAIEFDEVSLLAFYHEACGAPAPGGVMQLS